MCKTLFGVFGSLNTRESVSMITGKNKLSQRGLTQPVGSRDWILSKVYLTQLLCP